MYTYAYTDIIYIYIYNFDIGIHSMDTGDYEHNDKIHLGQDIAVQRANGREDLRITSLHSVLTHGRAAHVAGSKHTLQSQRVHVPI